MAKLKIKRARTIIVVINRGICYKEWRQRIRNDNVWKIKQMENIPVVKCSVHGI